MFMWRPSSLGSLSMTGDLGAVLGELEQQLLADVGVGHFAAAEADGDLHPVALGQELLRIAELDVEVVDVDAGDMRTSLISTTRWFFLRLLLPLRTART